MIPSKSENNGLAHIKKQDLKVYSVGISTAGEAEIRLAKENPERYVIATTIDQKGADFVKKRVLDEGLSNQIEIKLEDVSKPLPYADGHFDYIYARLVLHYLPKPALKNAISELHRIVKKDGKLFVVVRSTECNHAQRYKENHDPDTRLTTCRADDGSSYRSYFHTEESIQEHLSEAGFSTLSIQSYEEQLCEDFERTCLSKDKNVLIEVLAKSA